MCEYRSFVVIGFCVSMIGISNYLDITSQFTLIWEVYSEAHSCVLVKQVK